MSGTAAVFSFLGKERGEDVEFLNTLLSFVTNAAVLLFEFIGVFVIAGYGVYGIVCFFRHDAAMRLKLANGLATGLEFKLGSEILRTVLVRDLSEIAIVGAIILLRAALAFLIHWEIKNEEAHSGEEPRQM